MTAPLMELLWRLSKYSQMPLLFGVMAIFTGVVECGLLSRKRPPVLHFMYSTLVQFRAICQLERNDIANLGLACTQKTASKSSWGGEYAKNICTIYG